MMAGHRIYREVVDGESFELQLLEHPDPTSAGGRREYVVRRGGEPALSVLSKGYGFYYVCDGDGRTVGHVQHSRRGALLAAALLLIRGLVPPAAELGDSLLRRIVADRLG